MNNQTKNRIEAVGNGIAMLLGLAFLGDVFELWSFHPFDCWWVLFLYIPIVCGFLAKGITPGGVLLTLTAIVLTVGMFADVDGRLWSVMLILYIAYMDSRMIHRQWNTPAEKQTLETEKEAAIHHEL